jgi:hypothetical protein
MRRPQASVLAPRPSQRHYGGRTLLAEVAGATGAGQMAITNLPQNYRDLIIQWYGNIAGSTPQSVYLNVETSPTAIYSYENRQIWAANVAAGETLGTTGGIYLGAVSSVDQLQSCGIIHLYNYARTDVVKNVNAWSVYFQASGDDNIFFFTQAGVIYQGNPITQVNVLNLAATWDATSRLVVWGLR